MAIISWADVNARYPETAKIADATQADSSWVLYGIAELESKLSANYATPFSLNNLTAKDLAIDLVYAKVYRYKDPKKAEAVIKYTDSQIAKLNNGQMAMITTSGDVLISVGGAVYSTTENYHPVFGVSPTEWSVVSSTEVIDEDTARGINRQY